MFYFKVYFWKQDITERVNQWIATGCKNFEPSGLGIGVGSRLFGDRNLRFWSFTINQRLTTVCRKPYWEKDPEGYNTFNGSKRIIFILFLCFSFV